MNLLSIFSGISDLFWSICLMIDGFIYTILSSSYKIFMALAGAKLLSSTAYKQIADRIYIIIGVVMLFVLAYAILKAIVDPDAAAKGDFGGAAIVKKLVIAVLGLALTPSIFSLLYKGQNIFLEEDVIGTVFFRKGDETLASVVDTSGLSGVKLENDDGKDLTVDDIIREKGGNITAISIFQAFFYPSLDGGKNASEIKADASKYYLGVQVGSTIGAVVLGSAAVAITAVGIANSWNPVGWVLLLGAGVAACIAKASSASDSRQNVEKITQGKEITLADAYLIASTDGEFGIFSAFVKNIKDGEVEYRVPFALICGAFACYCFLSFSFDMGIRSAKLAYYQIIAPIPLILQILPKFKSNFSQYVQSVIDTFIEVFVRISVVYIVIFIICRLREQFGSDELWGSIKLNNVETMLATAILIMGLIMFAKEAPDMITKTFGISNSKMSLGIKDKLAKGGAFAAGALVGGTLLGGSNNIGATVRSDRFKNAKWGEKAGMLLGSAGKGLVRGAAYSGQNLYQHGGKVQNLSEMNNYAKKSGEKTGDAERRSIDKRSARQGAQAAVDDVISRKDTFATEEAYEEALGEARKNARVTRWETSSLYKPAMSAMHTVFGTINTAADEALLSSYQNGAKFKDSARSAVSPDYDSIQKQKEREEQDAKEATFEKAKAAGYTQRNGETPEDMRRRYVDDRSREIQKYNDALETLRDFRFSEAVRNPGKALNALNGLLQNAATWKENGSELITLPRKLVFDKNKRSWVEEPGDPKTITLAELVKNYLGEDALLGDVQSSSAMLNTARTMASQDVVYVVDRAGNGFKYTHTINDEGKVTYTKYDSDGKVIGTYDTPKAMEEEIQKAKTVKNNSTVNTFANTLRNNSNRPQGRINEAQRRKRQAEKK